MHPLTLWLLALIMSTEILAQTNDKAVRYPLEQDIATIDGIISATYEAVSGKQGAKRNWARDRSLHHPAAIYAFPDSVEGELQQVVMSVSDFHQETDTLVSTTGFYESEINREVRIFGNIAHVWSTYQTQFEPDGPVMRRGINSIQLFYDQDRWWIISWTFDRETRLQPIPTTFLPQ
ncbi:MAG: hypothetical protein AAF992_19335 [Bacteroidota bacterium]